MTLSTETLNILLEEADQVYGDMPILRNVVVTQAILESGYERLQGASVLATKYHNLFGIKGKGNGGTTRQKTGEHLSGQDVKVLDNFAIYLDDISAFKAHRTLMEEPRYRSVYNAQTESEAFYALKKCGYATDPNYPIELNRIFNKYF